MLAIPVGCAYYNHVVYTLCYYSNVRVHMNPSPLYGGMQVQVKLSRPGSSSHMAFASHGIPSLPVQSSVLWTEKKQVRGFMATY